MIYAITDGRVHLLPEAKITWPRWRHRPIGLARKSQQLFAGIIPMDYLVPWPASHRERSGCAMTPEVRHFITEVLRVR